MNILVVNGCPVRNGATAEIVMNSYYDNSSPKNCVTWKDVCVMMKKTPVAKAFCPAVRFGIERPETDCK